MVLLRSLEEALLQNIMIYDKIKSLIITGGGIVSMG